MATLDETDLQTMTELLAKLGIEGEVSSLEDLKALIMPKKQSEIKKERLSHGGYVVDEEDAMELLLLYQNLPGSVVQHQSQKVMCHLQLGNMKLKD